MKYIYTIMLGVSLVNLKALGMDEAFTPIQDWQAVTPFAGKIVAFKTTSKYFARKGSQYIISENSTYYGYIQPKTSSWNTGEQGYELETCLYKNALSSVNALVDSKLKDASMQIRPASDQEKKQLLEALSAGAATFDFDMAFKDAILAALKSKE